jgi:hypothetical protein
VISSHFKKKKRKCNGKEKEKGKEESNHLCLKN